LVVGEGREKQKQVPVRLRSSAAADDRSSGQAFGSAESRFATVRIFLRKDGYERDEAVVPSNKEFKTDMVKLP
jgi:hypothetical protein